VGSKNDDRKAAKDRIAKYEKDHDHSKPKPGREDAPDAQVKQ
jgi:hypothetical protein